jgi:hypothetical protein
LISRRELVHKAIQKVADILTLERFGAGTRPMYAKAGGHHLETLVGERMQPTGSVAGTTGKLRAPGGKYDEENE